MKYNRLIGQYVKKYFACVLAAVIFMDGQAGSSMVYAAGRNTVFDVGIHEEDIKGNMEADMSLVQTEEPETALGLDRTDDLIKRDHGTDWQALSDEVLKGENKRGEVPAAEEVKEQEDTSPYVIEVGDLASFVQAVGEVSSSDDLTSACTFTKDSATAVANGEEQTAQLVDPFQNKRLIVKSPQGFDPHGAESIIQGYGQLFILTYATEEETKSAYEYLQTIPYLTVEPDSVLAAATAAGDGSLADTEDEIEEIADNAGEERKKEEEQTSEEVSDIVGESEDGSTGEIQKTQEQKPERILEGSSEKESVGEVAETQVEEPAPDAVDGSSLTDVEDGQTDKSGSEDTVTDKSATIENVTEKSATAENVSEASDAEKDKKAKEQQEKSSKNTMKKEETDADLNTAGQEKHRIIRATQQQIEEKHAVTVAVLDTGYDFAGAPSERVECGVDVSGSGNVQDSNGHGTSVADIVLTATGEDICVFPVKVADENGRSSSLRLYLGMEEALYYGASVVNISMSAYRPADGSLVAEEITRLKEQGIFVVTAAGNYGGDTADYVPANVPDAVVVSAINEKDEADAYSNHGSTVDYCAYGSVNAKTLDGEEESISGTSVSAAIVSAVIAEECLKDMDAGYDAVIESLNAQAKDLGDIGRDDVYGIGAIYADRINGNAEEEWKGLTDEILNCDWKNMSDEAFNLVLAGTDNMLIRYFLDQLTEAEKEELLARDTLLTHQSTNIAYDPAEEKTVSRETGTLYEYLYSQDFSEYYIQKDISGHVLGGTYYMYIRDNKFYTAALDTSKNGTNAYIKVKFYGGSGGNPFTNPQVSVSATNAGAIDFSSMTIEGVKTFVDDNGHANTIGQLNLNGIKVLKPAHSKATGYVRAKNVADLLGNGIAGTWSGGVTDYGKNTCSAGSTMIHLAIGYGDLEMDKKDKGKQVYTVKITEYGESEWSSWSDYAVTQNVTCSQAGSKYRTHYKTCKNCGAVTRTETDTKSITQLAHAYTYRYQENNGVENGMRYQECTRSDAECGRGKDVNGETWQKDFQYYQYIGYRLMDTGGNYPADYTAAVNKYCLPGELIGECGTEKWIADMQRNEFMAASNAVESYMVSVSANSIRMDIPRKRYHVVFDGNGATSGFTAGHTNICVGKTFTLNKNGFKKTGYDFMGWSQSKNDHNLYKKDRAKISKDLSTTNGETITLYAIWEPHVYKITLDNQGADKSDKDTSAVYEKYTEDYYQDETGILIFPDGRINIPKKTVTDDTLLKKQRKQFFLGYYTKKNASGDQMVKADGTLVADMAGKGNYRYFTSDATVYAAWEDMYAIQYDLNLTDKDMEILSHDNDGNVIPNPVTGPEIKWKQKGKDITIKYETVSIANETFKPIYRLMGYSLTPEITSEDEIVLSEEKDTYHVTEDKDIILYAQWDTSFMVTYMGNKQTEGNDYLDKVEDVTEDYLFSQNDKEAIEALENDADYFVKTVERPTIDIATGNDVDEDGKPYMETVPYSFQGWSMYSDKKTQDIKQVYGVTDKEEGASDVVIDAENVSKAAKGKGLTFGNPAEEYGTSNAPHMSPHDLIAGGKGESLENALFADAVKGYLAEVTKMPYVNLYAIWDEYPQIAASDIYLPLSYAQEGRITEEYLLGYAVATDEELKSTSNTKGILKHGTDSVNGTIFKVLDYQASEFLGAGSDMAMSITYHAEDAVGNVTEKMVMVHLADTTPQPYEPGYVRFISKEYEDTLEENSIWRSGEYAETLAEVLNNSKTGEEYTTVSPLQQALGVKPVKKPGSGTWKHVEQVWRFTHEEVLAVQEYIDANGLFGSQEGFLATFGHCRVQ